MPHTFESAHSNWPCRHAPHCWNTWCTCCVSCAWWCRGGWYSKLPREGEARGILKSLFSKQAALSETTISCSEHECEYLTLPGTNVHTSPAESTLLEVRVRQIHWKGISYKKRGESDPLGKGQLFFDMIWWSMIINPGDKLKGFIFWFVLFCSSSSDQYVLDLFLLPSTPSFSFEKKKRSSTGVSRGADTLGSGYSLVGDSLCVVLPPLEEWDLPPP